MDVRCGMAVAAKGLQPPHRPEQSDDRVQYVDALVEERASARAVVGGDVAGVRVPRRRPEVRELAGRERDPPEAAGCEQAGQPAEARRRHHGGRAEQQRRARLRCGDERARRVEVGGQRLLAEHVQACFEARRRDLGVRVRRGEAESAVEPLRARDLADVARGAGARRPTGAGGDGRAGAPGVRVAARDELDARRHLRERRQVAAQRDVAASDDGEPRPADRVHADEAASRESSCTSSRWWTSWTSPFGAS